MKFGTRILGFVLLSFVAGASMAFSQLDLRTTKFQASKISGPQLGVSMFQGSLFPRYVQENPMNFAPLCRMELKIEHKLPVGVWFRADGVASRQVTNPGLAYLRFKVPLGAR
jgi:hypothetical protein